MIQELIIDTLIVVFLGCLVGGYQHKHSGKHCGNETYQGTTASISTAKVDHP